MSPNLKAELSKYLESIGVGSDVLSIIGSIDDTLSEEEAAELLRKKYERGTIWESIEAN